MKRGLTAFCAWTLLTLMSLPAMGTESFQAGHWSISVDRGSGCWRELKWRDTALIHNSEAIPPFELQLKGADPAPVHLESVERDAANCRLTLRYGNSRVEFHETITFGYAGRPDCLKREVSFRFRGKEVEKFGNFTYHFPVPAEKAGYYNPGVFFSAGCGLWGKQNYQGGAGPRQERAGNFAELGKETKLFQRVNPRVNFLLPGDGKTLIFFRSCLYENSAFGVARPSPRQGVASQVIYCSGWADPELEQHLDPIYLEVSDLPHRQALQRTVPALLKATGWSAPVPPAWILEGGIYGLRDNMRYRQWKLADLEGGLADRIAGLGFAAIWLFPVTPGPASYTPESFDKLNPDFGNWQDYETAVKSLKAHGLNVLQDVCPHGYDLPLLSERPVLEDGTFLAKRSADFNSRTWNETLRAMAERYLAAGVMGFRVDAPAGTMFGTNWRKEGFPAQKTSFTHVDDVRKPVDQRRKIPISQEQWHELTGAGNGTVPPLGYERASLASIAGGRRVSRTYMEAAERSGADRAVLLEAPGLEMSSVGHLTYDIRYSYLPGKFRDMAPADFVRELALYLEEQSYTEAPGAFFMRYTDCNDDRTLDLELGPAGNRAMLALRYLIRGVPMVYEAADLGHGNFIRQLAAYRRFYPELARGDAGYRVAPGAPEVLLIERRLNGKAVLAAVNFSGKRQTLELPLLSEWKEPVLFNAWNRESPVVSQEKKSLSVEVGPFQYALIADRLPPAGPVSGGSVSASPVLRTGDAWGNREYEITLDRATGLPGKLRLQKAVFDAPLDLILPHANAVPVPRITADETGWRSVWDYPDKTNFELSIRAEADGTRLYASGSHPDVKLLISSPPGTFQADGADLLFDDTISARFAAARPVRTLFDDQWERRPEDNTRIFNSRIHPLNPVKPEVRCFPGDTGLSVAWKGNRDLAVYRNWNNRPGIHLLFSGEGAYEMTLRPVGKLLSTGRQEQNFRFGEWTLTRSGIFWRLESSRYRLTLDRNGGGVKELFDKAAEKTLQRESDVEFSLNPGGKFHTSFDYETECRILPEEDGMTLQFVSCPRRLKIRDIRPPFPATSVLQYRFASADEIPVTWRFLSPVAAMAAPAKLKLGAETVRTGGILPQLEYTAEFKLTDFPLKVEQSQRPVAAPEAVDFSAVALRRSTATGGAVEWSDMYVNRDRMFLTQYSSYACPMPDGTAAWEMRFPYAVLKQSLSPARLEPGKYSCKVVYRCENLSKSAPFSFLVGYTTPEGKTISVSKQLKLSGTTAGWQSCVIELPVAENAIAPHLRLTLNCEPGGRLLIRSIDLAKE